MESVVISRVAVSASLAVLLLGGCGGSQPPTPGVVPQTSALATHVDRGRSWMLPEAKSEDLLYVAGGEGMYVYAYPSGEYVGTIIIDDTITGICSDKAGDVFVPSYENGSGGQGIIFEYAHGGTTPIATIQNAGNAPNGCAVDPRTGNLAVTNFCGLASSFCWGRGFVEIYPSLTKYPKHYKTKWLWEYAFCGYDSHGNLFVDGARRSSARDLQLAELPEKRGSPGKITLNQSITAAGGVQWDGAHVAVGDRDGYVIYEFAIDHDKGTKVGSTRLEETKNYVYQFWIQGKTAIVPSYYPSGGNVGFYNYPAGGAPSTC